MVDYTKYTDKAMLSKPVREMDELEKAYFDANVDTNTRELLDKYSDRPQLLNAVAMKLAEHVLKTTKRDEGSND